jgi:peptide/nickel transport system substrate-binding protein
MLKRTLLIAALLAAPLLARAQTSAAQEWKVPIVGKPAVSKDDYKPVVGTYGGRLLRDTLGEPKSFNPITAGETSTTEYTGRIFEGLTRLNPFTGEFEPLLAESFSVADDKVTWTFKLRKDVTFNDGTPLTAKDVEFTWNALIYDNTRPATAKDPRWPCSARDAVQVDGKPIQVRAVDDYTVEVKTAAPTPLVPGWMTGSILPEKLYAKFVADGTFGGAMGADSKPEDIVGTGAWTLGGYVRGQTITLKRNPKYWRKDAAGNTLPYLDEQVFRIAGNLNVMSINFQKGETDLFGIPSGREVPLFRPKQEEGNFTIWQLGPATGTTFLAFNMNTTAVDEGKIDKWKIELFRDRRFRQAVSHAIDRTALIRNVLRNMGRPLPAPYTIAPGPMKQDGFSCPAYDPAKAKAILADMGFKPGPDGVLVRDGQPLTFTLTTNAGNTIREEFANFIRKDLEAVGMKVNYLPLEFNLLVDKLDTKHDWEAMIMSFTGGLEPNDGANMWRSTGRSHLWFPKQTTPSTPWEKRIDEIFDAGVKELDPVKRKSIYREWIQIVSDEQPMIYLVAGEQLAAIRNRFGNLFPAALGALHNEEELFVLPPKK